jgi:hypothetical protein
MQQTYRVTTREYLAQGKDGYMALKNSKFLVDGEHGMLLTQIIRKYFMGAKMYLAMMKLSRINESKRQTTDTDHCENSSAARRAASLDSLGSKGLDYTEILRPESPVTKLIATLTTSAHSIPSPLRPSTPIGLKRPFGLVDPEPNSLSIAPIQVDAKTQLKTSFQVVGKVQDRKLWRQVKSKMKEWHTLPNIEPKLEGRITMIGSLAAKYKNSVEAGIDLSMKS